MITLIERCAKCGRAQGDHRFVLHAFQRPAHVESEDPSGSAAEFIDSVIEIRDNGDE